MTACDLVGEEMKDSSACGKRHVSRSRLLAMLLLCVVPLTAYGEELPVNAVAEPAAPAAPVVEPAIPEPAESSVSPTQPTNEPPAGGTSDTVPEPSTQEPQTEPESIAPSTQSTTPPAPAVINGFVFSGNTVIGNDHLQTVTQ